MRPLRRAAAAGLLAVVLAGCSGLPGGSDDDVPDRPDLAAPVQGQAQGGIGPSSDEEVTGLSPALRRSVDAAIAAAAAEGVELRVTSGWRTVEEQQALYDEAVATHGSAERARQWVLPPEESAHVRGEAVDVGPQAGAAWLQQNGERYGLCQRYDNEPWHFERLAGALGSRCPAREPHA